MRRADGLLRITTAEPHPFIPNNKAVILTDTAGGGVSTVRMDVVGVEGPTSFFAEVAADPDGILDGRDEGLAVRALSDTSVASAVRGPLPTRITRSFRPTTGTGG